MEEGNFLHWESQCLRTFMFVNFVNLVWLNKCYHLKLGYDPFIPCSEYVCGPSGPAKKAPYLPHVSKIIMIYSPYILYPLTVDTHRRLPCLAWQHLLRCTLYSLLLASALTEPTACNAPKSIISTYRHWSKHKSNASSFLCVPYFCWSDVLLCPAFYACSSAPLPMPL